MLSQTPFSEREQTNSEVSSSPAFDLPPSGLSWPGVFLPVIEAAPQIRPFGALVYTQMARPEWEPRMEERSIISIPDSSARSHSEATKDPEPKG